MRALETALLLAGGLPAALAIGPLRPRVATRGGARRAGRVAAVVGAVGFVAAAGVTRWALPPVALPTPTGAFAVGTSTVQWTDPGRPEPATPDPADRRTVVAQLWYPARPLPADLPRARYLGRDAAEAEAVGRGLAAQFGLPEIVFAEAELARTAAVTDAPAERAHGPYPVVLFSPGLAGVRSQNTAWAQELASHGYVVVALDHPYDSAAVVLADGRVVRSAVTASGDDAEDNRGGPRVTVAATGEFLDAVRAGRAPRLGAFGRVTARP